MRQEECTTVRRIGSALLILVCVIASGCEIPAPIVAQRGVEAYEVGQFAKATSLFKKVRQREPANWQANYYLGLIELRDRNLLSAQLLLENALTLRPGHRETPEIIDALAESLFQQDIQAKLRALLAEDSKRTQSVYAFLRQATYLYKLGDVDGARVAYRKAAFFAKKDDPTPYLRQADYFEAIGDEDAALTALLHALYIIPDNPRLHDRIRGYGVAPGPTVALPPAKVDAP